MMSKKPLSGLVEDWENFFPHNGERGGNGKQDVDGDRDGEYAPCS